MKQILALMFSTMALVACGEGGNATGATCPTTDAPTYANFAQQFMTTYCVECHKNYNSESQLKTEWAEIDAEAAKGANATNTAMPPANAKAKPSDAEREKLGQFLACIK